MTSVYIPTTEDIYIVSYLTMKGWKLVLSDEWEHPHKKRFQKEDKWENWVNEEYWPTEEAYEEQLCLEEKNSTSSQEEI